MLHTLKDIYLDYQIEHKAIDKTIYTNIIQEFNILIMEYILEGKEFNMGNNLSKCKIKNKSVYRFDATRGVKGNKEKLINLLKEDDLAYLNFKKYN